MLEQAVQSAIELVKDSVGKGGKTAKTKDTNKKAAQIRENRKTIRKKLLTIAQKTEDARKRIIPKSQLSALFHWAA